MAASTVFGDVLCCAAGIRTGRRHLLVDLLLVGSCVSQRPDVSLPKGGLGFQRAVMRRVEWLCEANALWCVGI